MKKEDAITRLAEIITDIKTGGNLEYITNIVGDLEEDLDNSFTMYGGWD